MSVTAGRTLVSVASTQYMVAEPIEEVREMWVDAMTDQLLEKGAVVTLTNVTGYWDPYQISLSPFTIVALEEAQPEQLEYTQAKTREAWADRLREIRSAMGFETG